MPIAQILLATTGGGGGPPPTPTYTFTPQTVSADEGSGFTFEIGGTNIVNGTYYWTIETSSGEFTTTSGSFTINNNYGVITVTPTADATTEVGAETFTVAIRSVSTSGTILATSSAITINDTSQSLVAPFSLDFPAGNPYLLVSNTQSDWNLGTTYTIEFWSKQTNASTSNIRTVMSQGPDYGKIDLGFMYGSTLFRNQQQSGISEPVPGIWNHVAYVADGGGDTKVYYNGILWGTITSPGALSDGSSDLNIGRRAGVNGQGFLGKLAMIRISTTAKYVANFSPSTSYGVGADTRLMLGSDTPLVDLSIYELNGIVTSQGNGSTIYFSKTTYPNLNNQVKAGDTVVDAGTLDTSTVTAAVYTADPDNWGINISPSQPGGTKNFSGTGVHPISVSGAVTVSDDFPRFQSLVFNKSQSDYLSTPASADWNLGTSWTIEFWLNANSSGYSGNPNMNGDIWGLVNQTGWGATNSINIAISDAKLVVGQGPQYSDVRYTEPTPAQWTHVAISNDAGTQRVFYNGVEQTKVSGTFGTANYANSTDSLAIGTMSGGNNYFDGKMAMVRISNSAKYLTAFTPTTTYNFETGTKLFLSKFTPTVDTVQHTITNNGVTTSASFPVTIIITNMSVGFNSRAATVDFTSTVSATTTGTIFFAWGGGTSGPHSVTVNPGSNTYTSPTLSLSGAGSDLISQVTIASGPNACTSNIYTGSWSVICLVEGTMVTMADGSYKAIEDIRYNDLLRVWNFDLGEFSEALPVFVKQEETHAEHYRFTFSDGTVLRTVGHHVFNKQAGEFTMLVRDTTPVGTITFNEFGEEVTLISKETIQEPVRFYNVWTQYHLNLFADGILTSNRFNNIYPIRDMKFVKDARVLRPLEEFDNIDSKYIAGLRLQEQPAQYSAEYIRDYVENKLERLDIANTVNYVHTE